LGMGLIGPMGPIGLMGQKPVMENGTAQRDSEMSKLGVESENGPAQRDSGMSILKTSPYRPLAVRLVPLCGDPYRPYCPYLPLVFKSGPAQRDSGNSNFGLGEHCHTESAEHTEKVILTKNIKNIMGYFMGRWGNESMSKMQNGLPQRHSKMSTLKIETEKSLPQRHSKMSNGRLSGVLCWPHGQKAMSTMQVKNMGGCFGRLSGLSCWPHGQQTKNIPVQRDSEISNSGMGLMGVIRVMGVMGRKHKTKNRPAQRDSGMSILGLGILGILRGLGILRCKTKNKTSPAQRDSGISILAVSRTGLTSPTRPTEPQRASAQRDSIMSNLGRRNRAM